MLIPKFWLIAGLMPALLFVIAACGGGEPEVTKPPESTTPDLGAIGAPPHVFVGTVSVDGSPAADGTLVTAFIDGNPSPVAQADVKGGTYTLMVEQPADADWDGKPVTFTVTDVDTAQSIPWEFGGANEVNLSVTGAGVSGGGSGSGTGGGTGGGGQGTGGGTGAGPDLAAQGKDIFTGGGGCAACHTIEGISAGMVGPDLTRIGAQGAERKPGLSAEEYLTESIRDPEAFVADVDRAIPGIMTSGLTAGLSDAEVDALVAFLLEQK